MIKIALSIEIILFAVIGGSGLVMGPVIGTFLLVPVGEMSRVIFEGGGAGASLVALINENSPAGEKLGKDMAYLSSGGGGGRAILLYGVILFVVCLVLPRGVLPAFKKLGAKMEQRNG